MAVTFSKASGVYESIGWKDLIGDINPKTSGVGSPVLTSFIDDIRMFAYGVGDDGDIIFHMPHDYKPGTDIYLHVHWSHNGTAISGTFDLHTHLTYAKGHQQDNYTTDVEPHIVVSGVTIGNTPRYHHRVDEIKVSVPGGSATQLDTNRLEVDGLIIVHYDVAVIPTITGGSTKVFIMAIDIHYESDRATTPRRSPNFYVNG